ncbi:hypothetical protein ABPG72_020249 [Tetrahymena utriculariae]
MTILSQIGCTFSVPEDYETLQNKSIQGKIFNSSAFYNLQGDYELVDRFSLNSLSIFKERNFIGILDHNYSLQLGQISEYRQNEDFFGLKFFQKVRSNLQHKKGDTYSAKNKINSSLMENSINLSLNQNTNQFHDLNCMQLSSKNQEFGRVNDSYSPNRGNQRQTIYNYQKAAIIVNKILNKSINRVQRVNQKVQTFIQLLQQKISNRKMSIVKFHTSVYAYQCYFLSAFVLFITDGLVYLNTAYFSQDSIILNLRYFKSLIFLTEMISLFVMGSKVIIPTQDLIYNPTNDLLTFAINFQIFLKLNGIQQKRNSFTQVFTLKENQKHMLRLFYQLLTVISIAHIVSLAWYYLGVNQIQSGYSITWFEKYNMTELSYIEKYIYSMYWSVTTMTTVEEQRDRNQQALNEILKLLSNKLRDEITVEVNSRIIKNCSLFASNFSILTLRKLPFIMKEILNHLMKQYLSKETMKIKQFILLKMVQQRYIWQARLILVVEKKQSNHQINVIKELQNNNMFGELSFFSGQARKACTRSLNLSTLYKIDRNEFISLIKENQEDFERFKMIEEQIKVQKDISIVHAECYVCKQIGHTDSDYPKIHSVFDSQFQILKDNFSVFFFKKKQVQQKAYKIAKCKCQANNSSKYSSQQKILSECSVKNYKQSDQEYSTDSYQSSSNQDQLSQTSIIDKFQNDQFHNSQTSLKDVQITENNPNQEKNNALNIQKYKNKTAASLGDNSEKCIQNMEQLFQISKEENKNLTADSAINQISEKNKSDDIEENVNANNSQKIIKHQQQINNYDRNTNQKSRKKKKNLTYQINQKQISNNYDIVQNFNINKESKSNQNNLKSQQQFNCKKNSFLQVNDLSLRPSLDIQLSNLSLKQFFVSYEPNLNYEDHFQKFEDFIKSQLDSPNKSDPKIENKRFFEYLLQNIKNMKKKKIFLNRIKAKSFLKKQLLASLKYGILNQSSS